MFYVCIGNESGEFFSGIQFLENRCDIKITYSLKDLFNSLNCKTEKNAYVIILAHGVPVDRDQGDDDVIACFSDCTSKISDILINLKACSVNNVIFVACYSDKIINSKTKLKYILFKGFLTSYQILKILEIYTNEFSCKGSYSNFQNIIKIFVNDDQLVSNLK